jgi:hypothetical protein
VTHVNGDGTVATLSSLASGKVKHSVHVQNCRVINPPSSLEQAEDWGRLLETPDETFSRKYLRSSAPLLGGENEEPEAILVQQPSDVINLDSDEEGTEQSGK